MQTAVPSSEKTARPKVSALAVAVCVAGLAFFCAIGSARLINEPFPGFLVLENGVIASISLSDWPIARQNESVYQHAVTAVNGHPVKTGKEVYTAVETLPIGSPITYTLEKDGKTTQVTFSSLSFQLEDYVFLQGICLFTGLSILVIGLVVWFLQPTNPASQALFLQCFTFGLYILTIADLYSPYWFFRVHVLCEALYPASFIHLALVFPVDRLRRYRTFWTAAPYGLALFVGFAYESTLSQPASYTWFHTLCESYSGLGILILLSGVIGDYWTSDSPLIRRRIGVILLGALGGYIFPAILMFSSSLTGGEVAVNNAFFTLFLFPLSIGYAIVKHDLFEIDTLIKRSVYYLTLTALLMLAYLGVVAVLNRTVAGSTVTQSPLFTLFFTSAVVLLLNPLKEYVQRIIDRLFFRLRYDPQAVLEAASNYLASTLRLEEIVAYLWNTIIGNLGIRQGAIYLFSPDHQSYRSVYPIREAPRSIAPTHPLLTILRQQNGRAFSAHHLESEAFSADTRAAIQTELERLQASLVVPLIFQGECIGLIALGHKESGRLFSTADLDFLHLLAQQGVLALSNARTYQELEELNKGLESKVADRTQKLARANTQLGQTNTELQTSLERLEHSQEQLVRAEKMAAFGRLTAGIAHEVNTPLGASMTSLTLIHKLAEEYEASIGDPEVTEQDYREITKEIKQYVSDTHKWLERAADYIQSLKRHSRSLERGVEGDFALLQILEDTERLLSHELRLSECRIVIENISPQLTLHGDSGKLGQVFTNLITNAIDAYKETDTGRGDIRIAVNDDGEDFANLHVLVQDQATGIPSEHCEQIFEEFFSTRLQGKGTGLGLGICRNIMNNFFSGTLTVESHLGQGSTFILKIPHRQRKSTDNQESEREMSSDDTLLAA